MFSPAGRKRTAAARPGTAGSAPGRSERCSVRAIVRSRSYRRALEIATEDRPASWSRIARSRSVNSRPGDVDDVDRPELAAAVGQAGAEARRVGGAVAELARRGGRERAAAGWGRTGSPPSPAPRLMMLRAASAVELEDLLHRHRGVDRDGGVGQRAQLLDVLVLEAGDLLDLGVAAVDGLEGRQALAQEVGGRLQRRLGRLAARQRTAQRGVMGLGDVEHRHLRGDRLAAQVVGGAERRAPRPRSGRP